MSQEVNTQEVQLVRFPGYSIDINGVVHSYRRKKRASLSPMKHPSGYNYIRFYANQKPTHVKIHRLMAETFLKKPDDGQYYEVNHKDGNKNNNAVSNLEWCTPSANLKHAYKLGLKKPIKSSQVWNAKLDFFKAQNIIHLYKSGVGPTNLARMYEVNPTSIYRILNGTRKRYQNV